MESLPARARSLATPRERAVAAAIAATAGLLVFLIATDVFPYHSSNHDEGVYLQQAELLLDGQVQFRAGGLVDAVRPWFFVEDGGRLYPKYQPLPAGLYAVAMAAFGEPRVMLALIAAGNTALVYVLGAMAFDRRTGVLAAVAFGFAPMTLISSSVFLPYAPTTLFNLTFAVLYIRAHGSGSARTAALAGGAIGIALFMRPFTAVLFALPFVAHATVELWRALGDWHSGNEGGGLGGLLSSSAVSRHASTGSVGFAFVILTLAYNAYITGDPFLFPYEAFAPLDGPGFGYRRILSHDLEYTPAVALQANGFVLRYLLTRWVFAGVAGTALAVLGVVACFRWRRFPSGDRPSQRLLAALFVTVPAGNVFFWGNYNVLSTMTDPTDGLLGQFGPFYHFDLLAPVAIFAAAGAVALWRTVRPKLRALAPRPGVARPLVAVSLVASLLLLGGVNAALLSAPLDRNAAHTDTYEDAYEPFEKREFESAAVFLPTPYGEWLNHPFQYLRNDPGLDGPAVYALDRGSSGNFAVADAYPDRQLYRYDYRGEWTADPDDRVVQPKLEPLSVESGSRLHAETAVTVPDRVSHATVRIEAAGESRSRRVDSLNGTLRVDWSITRDGVGLDSVGERPAEFERLAVENSSDVVVLVRLVQRGAGTLTYRQELSVRRTADGVEVLWPPVRTVCPIVDDCGREGTYIPWESRYDVVFETRLTDG